MCVFQAVSTDLMRMIHIPKSITLQFWNQLYTLPNDMMEFCITTIYNCYLTPIIYRCSICQLKFHYSLNLIIKITYRNWAGWFTFGHAPAWELPSDCIFEPYQYLISTNIKITLHRNWASWFILLGVFLHGNYLLIVYELSHISISHSDLQ